MINFDDLRQELRPCWLGHSTSRAQQDYWSTNLPFPSSIGLPMSSNRTLEAFKAKMELATDMGKNKSKAKRKGNQQQQVMRRQEMTKQLLRAQRYLGLVPKKDDDSLMPDLADLTLSPINAANPPPHPFDDDVIFVAMDVEAWERAPHYITEVGVATLDTRDLRDCAPGASGEGWQKHVRGRHFRIIEYKHMVNHDFVDGCPDRFEFGDSEFVGMDSVASELARCFHEPYSKKTDAEPKIEATAGEKARAQEEKRKIILLGHDLGQDIAYLRSIGFDVLNRSSLHETIDTASMFRSYTRDPNPRSLGSVLAECNLMGWNLHNAGNDAVYTVWAMLAICVKDASERGSKEKEERHVQGLERKLETKLQEAKERVKDEDEGWDSETAGDGGVPVKPSEADFETRREKAKKVFGPGKLPEGFQGLYTSGGAPLDV